MAAYPSYYARKRNSRGSPRKLRLAADLIRGKSAQEATDLLEFSLTKSARIMAKLLQAAISNAEQQNADLDSLAVARVTVNNGMVLKRRKPSGRGRVRGVYHRFSHLDLCLEDRAAALVPKPAPSKAKAKPASEAGAKAKTKNKAKAKDTQEAQAAKAEAKQEATQEAKQEAKEK